VAKLSLPSGAKRLAYSVPNLHARDGTAYVDVTGVTSYTVKLFGTDAQVETLEVLADDVLSAAGAAVPYFSSHGENIACASAIVVERGDSSFAMFRPGDVLAWRSARIKV